MADVTIEVNAYTGINNIAARAGPFWTSPLVGYVIYADSSFDLKYKKTADGGATWGAAVNIRTGSIWNYDCWADWQTVGDAGTKIHIVYTDYATSDMRYVYLDTSTDTVGGDDQIQACQGTGTLKGETFRTYHQSTITKTRGGNLAVALHHTDNADAHFYSFYTSPDADTWASEASPFEADGDDHILLFPGNELDNQDLWAIFWDVSAGEISLKTYDDSGNSWAEQSISLNMTANIYYLQMDGAIRLSDGHLIFAAWNDYNDAAADLMVWDINGAASITAKTNVITNEAEAYLVSVFVNQANDDIYIAYASGTTVTALVAVFYQKSVNGGTNWGGETALQADAEDNEKWISAGAIKSAWGGKFQPYWFNGDPSDLFTNTDNGIPITGPGWTGTVSGVSNPAAVMGVAVANIAKVKGVA